MACFRAVALLALLAVAAATEEKLLGELMRKGSAKAATAATASVHGKHGKPHHYEDVSLQLLDRKNCRFVNGGNGMWSFDSDIGCGDSKGHYEHHDQLSFTRASGIVGQCEFVRNTYTGVPVGGGNDWIPVPPIPGAGPAWRYGFFTVRCTLNADADRCSGVLCDGATITASGDMYAVEDVLTKGLPPTITENDGSCIIGFPFRKADGTEIADPEQPGRRNNNAANKVPAQANVKAASAQYDGYGDSYVDVVPATYYLGDATIYYGTIDSITTPDYDLDVEGGYFQLIRSFDPVTPLTPYTGSVEDKLVVDPYKISLRLQMEGEYE